ncbi:MAG: DNA mismatch repair protein MutS [Candidatus Puniceispirillaceae bacterium]
MTSATAIHTSKARKNGPTPMIAQYLAVKSGYEEALLFYRMGDFYEMFFQDAEVAAKALNLTLTKRGQLEGQDIAMCGVPVHAMDNYLARLIKQGFKVAICEQSEDPDSFKKRGGKGPLPRDVVRLVTPGTLNEDGLLAPEQNNFLAAIGRSAGDYALAWADMSTGQFQVQAAEPSRLEGQISRLQPAELIWPDSMDAPQLDSFCLTHHITASPQSDTDFDSQNALARLYDLYDASPEQGPEKGQKQAIDTNALSRAMLSAIGGLLCYLQKTQISSMPRLSTVQIVQDDGIMEIDPATRRSLELTRSMTNERSGSLLAAIDKTQSAAGARLLSARLSAPLTNRTVINERLDLAQIFVDHDHFGDDVANLIKELPDSERCVSRITMGRGGPRDLVSLRRYLLVARQIHVLLAEFVHGPSSQIYGAPFVNSLTGRADDIVAPMALLDPLSAALSDDVPLLARDGGFIKEGYSPKLDELRALRDESRRLIAALQSDYITQTGISSLKVKHNNVLGYHIDVRSNYADTLMADSQFIHRQTTAQTVRFTTTKLAELERDISSAADKALALELEVFDSLIAQTIATADLLGLSGRQLAEIDVATATAKLAVLHHYHRPCLYDDTRFEITKGRHPVVEQSLSADKPFMPNDCHMTEHQSLWLLTGPNMAGKSTFLRQNALIAIIAQAGLFVPADQAHIGVIDKCFSRVGASDDLARGQSTFMVEMVETATILNQATNRSLVILDEIGRGTATFDGLAIAHACLEYLHDHNGCRTLFATHYHELISLEAKLDRLYPCAMLVKEWQGDIVFLHQVGQGAAARSYGVHVAKLAGLPEPVVTRAAAILSSLEAQTPVSDEAAPVQSSMMTGHKLDSLPLFDMAPAPPASPHPAIVQLQNLIMDELTPRQALEQLYALRDMLDDGHDDQNR